MEKTKKKRYKLRKNKGVTLIALVITIIVLLILAGISISMLAGDNSILKIAGDARENSDDSKINEEINLAILASQISKKTNSNETTLKEELEKGISGDKTVEAIDGVLDVCYVKKGNKEITVYEDGDIVDGRVSVWNGISVESPEFKQENNIWNWYIYNPSQFKFFADFVNNGNALTLEQETIVTNAGYNKNDVKIEEDKTKVYLMSNIDLGARQNDGKLTSGSSWTPIGTEENSFTGIFEGNNYIIKGMYINLTDKTAWIGLFSKVKNIQNLSIKNGYIKCLGTTGAFTGSLMENGIIKNCHNINTTIESERDYYGNTAGITANAQKSTQIIDCTNSGKIIGFRQISGIVGWSGGVIRNCTNTGNINAKKNFGAGIVSVLSGTIEKCKNYGNIEGKKNTGGMVGYLDISGKVIDCMNDGTVSCDNYCGGIIGSAAYSNEITRCINEGTVKGEKDRIGGVIGDMGYDSNITDCKNIGNVIGKGEYIGGVIGIIYTDGQDPSDKGITTVRNCSNSGKVEGNRWTGGVIGQPSQYNSLIEKCYNLGEVFGNGDGTGGIVGSFGRSSKIYNCYNMKQVVGNRYVGGIAGNAYRSSCEIKNCYNVGKISGQTIVGGIIGNNGNSTRIENSYYLDETAELDEGTSTKKELNKNKEFITTQFITNSNVQENIWKIEQSKNDGWPIFND